MILHPAIMGLLVCETLSLLVLLCASILGWRIAAGWDISSTSSRQLEREQRAALVSVAVGFAMAFQILSLFLFVEAADRMHSLFTGAMCAAGTLHVNAFGYPALLVKIAAVLLCGTWLIINHADGRSPDYPLLRIKFRLLPPAALAAAAGGILFSIFATKLDPEVITSCCGVLFGGEESALSKGLPKLGPGGAQIAFFTLVALTLAAGVLHVKTHKGAMVYGAASLMMFMTSLAAILSFISPYYYQLPTHHCPFCMLQPEYFRSGYLLYVAIFAGGIFGAGTGVLALVARKNSIRESARGIQGRLCVLSMTAFAVVAAMAAWPLVFSTFRMGGY